MLNNENIKAIDVGIVEMFSFNSQGFCNPGCSEITLNVQTVQRALMGKYLSDDILLQ
jgi:hypothetical protein